MDMGEGGGWNWRNSTFEMFEPEIPILGSMCESVIEFYHFFFFFTN